MHLTNLLIKACHSKFFQTFFSMAGHAGFCGIFFGVIWIGAAFIDVPSYWSNGGIKLWITVGILAFLFLALLEWSSHLAGNFSVKSHDLNTYWTDDGRLDKNQEELDTLTREHDVRARKFMAAIMIGYILTCCTLIWLTGGARSLFILFYVMIFSLTFSKTRVTTARWFVFVAFFVPVIIVCIFSFQLGSFITRADLDVIRASDEQYYLRVFFIAASLFVPAISTYLSDKREEQRKKKRGESSESGRS